MIRYLLLLLAGFLGGMVAREGTRSTPTAPVQSAVESRAGRPAASPAVIAQIEDLLAQARQPSRTPAQLVELQRAVDRWLLADPMACIAWLQDRRATGLARRELLPSVCAFAFGGRMTDAMRHALPISDPLLHFALITAAFETAAELHPAEAFEALAALPAAKRVKLGEEIIARWARREPRKAWDALSASPNRQEALRFAGTCMMAWEATDPRGLRVFLREQLLRPNPPDALEFGLWSLAERPAVILEVLPEFGQHPRLQSVLQNALLYSARNPSDTEAALRFARAQPPGTLRQSALYALGLGLSQSDDRKALPEVLAELTPDARRALDPARKNWLFQFPPPKVSEILSGESDPFFRGTGMSTYVSAVRRHQTQPLIEMALSAESPPDGPDWLDMIAAQVRTDPLSEKPGDATWLEKLEASTRERLVPELQRRLSAEDWARVQADLGRMGK